MQSAVSADLLYTFVADVSICRERFTWSAALVRLLVLPMPWPRLGGYMIRTLRVLSASARGCYCYSYWSCLLPPTLFARFACSARGGGYTIRTLRVLSASVAASASYTIRTLRVLSSSAAASYTVLHCSHASRAQGSVTMVTQTHTSQVPLLYKERDTQTHTHTHRHTSQLRCLFFISKDDRWVNQFPLIHLLVLTLSFTKSVLILGGIQ